MDLFEFHELLSDSDGEEDFPFNDFASDGNSDLGSDLRSYNSRLHHVGNTNREWIGFEDFAIVFTNTNNPAFSLQQEDTNTQ